MAPPPPNPCFKQITAPALSTLSSVDMNQCTPEPHLALGGGRSLLPMCEMLVRRSFEELSDLQANLRTLRVKGVPLGAEEFRGSAFSMTFPDFAVEIVRTSPALLFGAAEQYRAGYLLLQKGSAGAKWDGRSVHERDVACLQPGSVCAASYPVPTAFAFVSAAAGSEESVFGCRLGPGAKAGLGIPVQRAPARAHEQLFQIAVAAEQTDHSDPDSLPDQEWGRAVRASMLAATRQLLQPEERPPSSRRRATGHQRVVRGADEYLCANPMRPIYTEDLCKALGASASALHEAFHNVFGISPHRYLKLRRMSLVRVALLSRSGPWASVKAAALSNGFWHFGQFARDYKETYGELPSSTLARARVAS